MVFSKVLQEQERTEPNGTDQRDDIVYYRRIEVVYGCTTPLIHLMTGSGCLFEKFFLKNFSNSIFPAFLKNFLIFFPRLTDWFLDFFIFFLQKMAGVSIFVVH